MFYHGPSLTVFRFFFLIKIFKRKKENTDAANFVKKINVGHFQNFWPLDPLIPEFGLDNTEGSTKFLGVHRVVQKICSLSF